MRTLGGMHELGNWEQKMIGSALVCNTSATSLGTTLAHTRKLRDGDPTSPSGRKTSCELLPGITRLKTHTVYHGVEPPTGRTVWTPLKEPLNGGGERYPTYIRYGMVRLMR